jgi:hypothetical protein
MQSARCDFTGLQPTHVHFFPDTNSEYDKPVIQHPQDTAGSIHDQEDKQSN